MLALSNLEIEAFIAEEVERNPLLDAERDGPDVPAQDSADEDWADLSGDDGDDPVTTERLIEADLGPDRDGPLDVDYAHETFHHDSAADGGPGLDGALGMTGASGSFDEDGPDFENFAAAGLSLHTYLMQQAGASLSGAELMIAGHIIAQIDEAGYLLMPLADMAQQLGVTLAACEDVLQHIQGFDPTGVGARSLAECIALQAKEANRYDPAMARLLDNLDVLALGRLPQLKRICGVDDEDLADMIRELRSYTPKPGLRFGGEPIQSLTPDIFVSRRGAGWAV
ncbi:MAG: RNA polymerase sigma-54 factor, partial [Sphingomonadaceae bacterium]|nr:RNA polymerase sigma-54 factor [Sphingomonadaceae bacterium]